MAYVRCLTWVTLVVAVFAGCGEGAGGERARPLEIGQPAPAYSAVTLAGAPIALDSMRGKVVLLNVWATWCHPCREEIPELERLYQARSAEGFEVVGVSVDSRGEERKIGEFIEDFGMTYPVWLDPDERVTSLFLAIGVPASYLIDADGLLRWKHIGIIRPDDPKLKAVLDSALQARQIARPAA